MSVMTALLELKKADGSGVTVEVTDIKVREYGVSYHVKGDPAPTLICWFDIVTFKISGVPTKESTDFSKAWRTSKSSNQNP